MSAKLSKRKKNALIYMDQLVLQRLSDYFTCWKLKVLLGQQSENKKLLRRRPLEDLDQSAELQLDFTTWRKEIQADE
jgi:hypothetical protein